MTDREEADATAAAIADEVRHLVRSGREMESALAGMLGVGVTDVQAVDHLVRSDTLGPTELGNRLGIRSASATVLVDRLVAAGHVRRSPHPGDGRRITLEATQSAREEVRTALSPLIRSLASITDAMTTEQRCVVADFLHRTNAAVEAFVSSAGHEE